jgi:hypothetical protein
LVYTSPCVKKVDVKQAEFDLPRYSFDLKVDGLYLYLHALWKESILRVEEEKPPPK